MTLKNVEITPAQAKNVRSLKLPQDVDLLGEMILASFQYPDNPQWDTADDERENILDSLKAIKKVWPLIRIAMIFSPPMRDLLHGYIWYEDDVPASLISVQRRGSSNNWMVGNVATMPDFRRRGLARKMVEMGNELIKSRGGKQTTLDVIDGNVPAYKLYESMGFKHFTSSLELINETKAPMNEPNIPADYRFEKTNLTHWQPRFQLAKRITPADVQAFEPIVAGRFEVPKFAALLSPLINILQNIKQERYYIYYGQKIVGWASFSARKNDKGRHFINLSIDPAHESLAQITLQWLLFQVQQIKGDKVIETSSFTWNKPVIDAAHTLGFTTRLKYDRMGLKLEK